MTGNIKPYLSLLFFTVGCICIFLSKGEPVKDFGNYYYGSKFFLDGTFNSGIYKSIHYFNQQIASYGETNFFENYIPVPPFSALFYAPLCFFKSIHAKLIFNIFSLLFFCISVYRLQVFLNIRRRIIYALPFIFFFPLYNNILQGQAYVLICALLIEVYIAFEKNHVYLPSLLTAIIISLKIFPIIILLFFLLKKNFKIAIATTVFLILLLLITWLALPVDTVVYYFNHILPRLFDNDVVGTYYHGNQSVYTALLNLFSYDAISNPNPLLNNSFLIIFFESLFFSFLLSLLFTLRKQSSIVLFASTFLIATLLGRYNTSYGMFLLFPLSLALITTKIKTSHLYLTLFCIMLTISIPVGSLSGFSFFIKFARLWDLLLLIFILMYSLEIKINYKLLAILFIPVFFLKYFSFPVLPINYFQVQNAKGILFDIKVETHSIKLISTLGEKDFSETFDLDGQTRQSDNLTIQNNVIYFKNKMLCDSKDNKLNPFIYNERWVVFMSDLNQAVGFYKLRYIPL